MSDERARIRVGPAGWDYPDWRGIVYPNTRKTKTFDELAYLARFFDTVEINSTFYRPGDPKAAAGWVKRVAHTPAFKFTAKLWRRFTHERTGAALNPAFKFRAKLCMRFTLERTGAWTADEVKLASAVLQPLQEADRLGAVLLQFPWSFKCDDASVVWLCVVLV